MAKGVWGLDVSRSSLKAVRLQSGKENLELTDLEIIEYPFVLGRDEAALEQEIKNALAAFLSRHKLRRDLVVASLPVHSTFNRFIKLPPVAPDRLKEIIQFEAQQHIPFPLNEVIWRYQSSGKPVQPGEEMDVGIFAIKKELVDQFSSLLASVGVNVDIVQFNPVALYNFVMFDYDLGRNFIILDIGANNTDLILVDEERFWIRNIPIVGNDITKTIQQKFDISFSEAEQKKTGVSEGPEAGKIFNVIQNVLKDLTSEIHRSIGYYKSLSPLGTAIDFNKIILAGNASKTVYFEEFLSQRLQLEPLKITRLNKIEPAASVKDACLPDGRPLLQTHLASFGVALGLALQGLELTPNRVNLVAEKVIRQREISKKKPWVAALAVVLALILAALHFSGKKELKILEEINNEAQAVLKNAKQVEINWDEERKIEELRYRLKEISCFESDRDVWIRLLNVLNNMEILRNNAPALAKGYVENNNPDDLAAVQKFEQNKIWILKLNADKGILAGINKQVLTLTIICAMVCQVKDNVPNLLVSQEFIKQKLVKPLVEEFKCEEHAPEPVGGMDPVPGLLTPEEEKSISGLPENKPKYYRFKVTLEIPLSQ